MFYTSGPCVGIDNQENSRVAHGSHSAIYCAGNRCDERLLVSNDMTGVCEEGEVFPDPYLECSKTFYKCLTDDSRRSQYWSKQRCPENEVFSRFSLQCNETCKL